MLYDLLSILTEYLSDAVQRKASLMIVVFTEKRKHFLFSTQARSSNTNAPDPPKAEALPLFIAYLSLR